nr:gas vesicle protein K [Salimicrobium jeotgali]
MDPAGAEEGLAQLVLTVIELLRDLVERQAIRRVEGGRLTEEQEEELGIALMNLETKMDELKEVFNLTDEDLNLDLGPLGKLM